MSVFLSPKYNLQTDLFKPQMDLNWHFTMVLIVPKKMTISD